MIGHFAVEFSMELDGSQDCVRVVNACEVSGNTIGSDLDLGNDEVELHDKAVLFRILGDFFL